MAGSDIFTVRSFFAALQRGDMGAVRGLVHPKACFEPTIGEAQVYRGEDAVDQLLADLLGRDVEVSIAAQQVVDRGDHLLTFGRVRSFGPGSQVSDRRVAWCIEVRDDKIALLKPGASHPRFAA